MHSIVDAFRTLARRILGRHSGAPPSSFIRVAYRVPRQVVLITARHAGHDNVWPMDWHIPLSIEPKLYCIASSKTSYGAEMVRASGAFIVHFVPAAWEDMIFKLGSMSGRDVNKFDALKLSVTPGATVDAPRIAGALGLLECVVTNEIDVGDHTLFIARVTAEEVAPIAPRLHHIDSTARAIAGEFEKHV